MLNPDNIAPIKPNQPNLKPVSDSKSRPQGLPQSKKDFKKMIDHPADEQANQPEDVAQTKEIEDKPSLFDLSSKKTSKVVVKKESDPNPEQIVNQDGEGSEESLFASPTSLRKLRNNIPFLPDEESDFATQTTTDPASQLQANEQTIALADPKIKELPIPLPREQLPKDSSSRAVGLEKEASGSDSKTSKSKSSSLDRLYAQEKGNSSYINLPSLPILAADGSVSGNTEAAGPSQTIQDIVEQVVKNMQTIENQGKTDTVVTLQYPPLLKGANVVLTSFESAPKEFNIAFTNLEIQAKQFLDQRLSQDSLTMALENKGFVVHMITTTTLADMPIRTDFDQEYSRGDDGQGSQQQGQSDQSEEDA